ncbi:MAG TPA: permease-like cell division protein FtsX [Chromatiaceae bacterium]|nr:permease-like cell division protein FtsX [Chromatiaceae bacterium]
MPKRSRNPLRRPASAPAVWFAQHGRSALASLGDLARAPLATVLTVAVVGIALALPASLHLATGNLARLAQGWQQDTALSVFLAPGVDEARIGALAGRLGQSPDLAQVRVITPAEGLAELRAQGGLTGALDLLPDNPLPTVLALVPSPAVAAAPGALEALRDALVGLPEVEAVRLDSAWVARLHALIHLAGHAAALLAALLATAVLLVVGNTLRLEIANRRGEIELMSLVGATQAFVRRPFLYSGAWYGLLGGVLAAALATLALVLIQAPVSRLAGLYGTEFHLAGLDPAALLALFLGGPLLGLIGAWLAVGRHLAACKPR